MEGEIFGGVPPKRWKKIGVIFPKIVEKNLVYFFFGNKHHLVYLSCLEISKIFFNHWQTAHVNMPTKNKNKRTTDHHFYDKKRRNIQ